ncbi:11601_t:CDS:2, partial [Funneliformis mosseae]
PYSDKKELKAINDIYHTISKWYIIILERYNNGLLDDRKFESFYHLYGQVSKVKDIRKRLANVLRSEGTSLQDLTVFVRYKIRENYSNIPKFNFSFSPSVSKSTTLS